MPTHSPPYARLESEESHTALSADEDDDDTRDAADSTLTTLQPFFDELQARLASAKRQHLRPAGSGIVVRLAVGEICWLIDLRDGTPPERAIQRVDVAAAAANVDVGVVIADPADMQLLLLKRLSPLRALALKKITLSGDLRQLHAMEWLLRAGQSEGDVAVRVVETAVVDGHGEYHIRVEEGAACWSIRRRWRELRELSRALHKAYGKGSALNLPLPRLGSSVRSSAASSTLHARAPRVEAYLRAVIAQLACVPTAAQGPPALLTFLGVGADGALLGGAADGADTGRTRVAAEEGVGGGGGGERAAAQLPLRQLLMQRDLARASSERDAARASAARASRCLGASCAAWAAALLALLALLALGPAAIPLAPPRAALLAAAPHLAAAATLAALAAAAAATLATAPLLGRYLRVFALFWRMVCTYRLARLRASRLGEAEEAALWERTHEAAGAALKRQMLALGGLWVKFGQYMATRVDVIPATLSAQLASMLDSNPPRPLESVVSTLVDTFGEERLCAELASVDPVPMSVASIAQVHRATLARGEEVVVKVQHDEVGSVIQQDLRQLSQLGRWLAWLEPQLDLRPILDEMAELHAAELDFTLEAASMNDVADSLRRRRVSAVLPSVIRELTSRRVLTMSFCHGRSLKEVAAARAGAAGSDDGSDAVDCEVLLSRITECWAVQMFADGVFNCDPHPGNLLVQQTEGRGPLPVLLDFGLTKRLTSKQQLAFCSVVHALAEFDPDLLISAIGELGFVFHESLELDPFEMMAGFLFYFRDTEKDANNSRARIRQRIQEGRARQKAASAAWQKTHGKESPLKALPGVLAFFVRTVQMLQGLCTLLKVSIPFLKPMASWAERTLLEHARRTLALSDAPLRLPPRAPPTTALQGRVLRLMDALLSTGELLGAQVCLIYNGRSIVDAACGTMGVIDPRPVRADTLFQIFEAGAPIIATLALQEVARGTLGVRDPIAAAWPEFAANGKEQISLAALLNHTSGLSHATPNAKMAALCDPAAMSAHIARSAPAASPVAPSLSAVATPCALRASSSVTPSTRKATPASGSSAQVGSRGDATPNGDVRGGEEQAAEYEGAPWGWAVAGLLDAVCGRDLPSLLRERIGSQLADQSGADLMLAVDEADQRRVAKHTTRAFGGLAAVSQMMSAAAAAEPEADGEEMEGDDAQPALLDHLAAAAQLSNPATLNVQQLRKACLPGLSMHASAHALASFYAALGGGKLVPASLLAQAAQHSAVGSMKGISGRWGLGMQLGECRDSQGPRRLAAFGHVASGGTLGLCVPQAGLAMAITVNKLSRSRLGTSKLSELVLAEFGLRLSGFFD